MSRPRSFDESTVLNAVMMLFWRGGYCSTSMDDIECSTGVMKPSLYRCFGKKEELFLRSYDLYEQKYMSPLLALLDEGDGLTGIKSFNQAALDRFNDDTYPHSCFCVRTVSDAPPVDGIKERVKTTVGAMEGKLRETVLRGQEDGSIAGHLDPTATAHLLVSTLFGVAVMDTICDDASVLCGTNVALTAILAPAPKPV